jgi:TolB-like protein/Tfp pilus assembly protein PilF
MSFFEELKRRNVFRVGIAYAVSAWVLLQVADLVLDNIEAPGWVMHVLMLVAALGFVVALVVAWAYELTPEGIKRESEITGEQSITHHTARRLDKITLVAVGVLVVFLALDRFALQDKEGPDPFSPEPAAATGQAANEKRALTPPEPIDAAPSISRKSIAVLPLANRSVNPEDAFFAQGIHDEILTRLSRIAELKVISRTSVMGYANTTKRMAEIGQELGVATLLEGGVQRAGNRVRINVQLIEAQTDRHLWAEIFDRELTADNLFDIQSEITRAISDALQAVLSGDEQLALNDKPTDNVEAYAHYLRGKASSLAYGRVEEDLRAAIEAYQAAIELDPDFADAWAAMAIDWLELHWTSIARSDERENARLALEKAQALAPEASDTLTAKGYYHYWGFRDYEPAIAAFEEALRLQPGNQMALRGKAYALRRMGRLDDAIRALEQVMALDPLNAQVPADLAYTQMHTGQYASAERMYRHAMAQNPRNFWNTSSFSGYYSTLNEVDRALEILGAPSEEWPEFLLFYAWDLARMHGNTELVERTLEWLRQASQRPEAAHVLKLIWDVQQGIKPDTAELDALERSLGSAAENTDDPSFEYSNLVLIKAMQGDLPGLERVMARYQTELKPDALRIVEDRNPMLAWAIIGEYDKVLDIAEELESRFGPWEVYNLVMDPLFDGLRGNPRYKLLALQYDRWLETVK